MMKTDDMNTDDTLGERLRAAVPAEPDTSQWAAKARRKRQRLQGAVATTVAVALMAGVAGAWLATQPGPTIVAPASPPPLTQVNGELTECSTTPGSGSELPKGATSVTLCAAGTGFQRMWAPLDRLVTDVDRYVDLVNSAELMSGNYACTEELGPEFKAVFAYADGSHKVINGALYGCRTMTGDIATRRGASAVFEALLDGWRDQRAALPLTIEREGTWCPVDENEPMWGGRPSMLPPSLDSIVAAHVCQPYSGRVGQFEAAIPASDVGNLVADIGAHATAGFTPGDFTGRTLVLASASGDLLTLAQMADGGYIVRVDGLQDEVWRPGPAAQKILDDAVK